MSRIAPPTPEELATLLRECASSKRTIALFGNSSKSALGGPVQPAGQSISTSALHRVLCYEPRDLTISVEAGCRFSDIQNLLAKNGQMIALDPPFSAEATIGGVIAANSSGPLRRAYGTARDLVIGMRFATLEGKLVQTGGMVVKNVAGLDMGKIMIGSFGTLAAIVSVNFRLHSLPEQTETFLYTFPELDDTLAKRNTVLNSVLQPVAVDLLSPGIAVKFGLRGCVLAIRAAGSEKVLARYRKEFADSQRLGGSDEATFWLQVSEFPASFLARQPEGIIARVSTTLQDLARVPKTVAGAYIARAANGIAYFYFPAWSSAAPWWRKVQEQGLAAVIEAAPNEIRAKEDLWSGAQTPAANEAFIMMKKVKQMFDPDHLLNPKRLYGRI